jgi:hypothetical protein
MKVILINNFMISTTEKILIALMRWEEEEKGKEEEKKEREQQESVIPIDKRQLKRIFFQKVNDLFPLPPGATLDSIVVQFYQLKKELLICDPNWKFMTSDFRYLGYILPLLDAINIQSEKHLPDVTRCVKVCKGLYHETRIRKKEDPLWNLDVERLVDFLYPQPPEEESGAVSQHGQS